jgi:hypothetical protein
MAGGFVATSSGTSGASSNVISECGTLSFVSLCGTPQYVANQLATDEMNYVESVYDWTTTQQAAVYSNMVSDINIVAGFGAGLPASEQSQIESDLSTTKIYFDEIKANLIINDPSFQTNAFSYAFENGLCKWLGDLCIDGF